MTSNHNTQMQSNLLPWIVKYRPPNLDSIISHTTTVNILRNFISEKQVPHILFHGPPGTGKTSMAKAMARELYGESYDMMTLEINASEERGIEVVRNKITQFVTSKSLIFGGDNSLFKLVILDEADAMTTDAQASLRRIIETYSKNARFCLICNYVKNIDVALQSRCICFRFSPLKHDVVRNKIKEIADIENVKIDNAAISIIIKRSNGDMRRILNVLQTASMGYESVNETVVNICFGYPNFAEIAQIVNIILHKDFKSAVDFIQYLKTSEGYSLSDIVMEIYDVLIKNVSSTKKKLFDITTEQTMKILSLLAEVQQNIICSTSDDIQITSLVGIFKYIINNPTQIVKDL